jgi:hypothetical protein
MIRMQLPQVFEVVGSILRMMAMPADETPAQRVVRKAEEEEARLLSEQIDKEINGGAQVAPQEGAGNRWS